MQKFCNYQRRLFLFLISPISLIALLAPDTLILAEEAEKEPSKDGILPLYEKLTKLEIDPSRAVKLENFSFKKDQQ